MDERLLPGILTLLIVVLVFALMWWGWRNKLKRQQGLGELPEVPQDLGAATISVPGQYVVTTAGGDWLDRLAVHNLGVRTTGVVHVHTGGVIVERSGAQDIFIAAGKLREIGTQSGMVGKFVEKDGLVVIGWLLENTEVDTGFRTTEAGAKRPLIEALQALLPQDSDPDDSDTESNGKNN